MDRASELKIYTIGIDQLVIINLKAHGYTAILQNHLPEPKDVEGQILFVSSQTIPHYMLPEFRKTYPCQIVYHYTSPGLKGYMHVYALCESLGITFISPRATMDTILDTFNRLCKRTSDDTGNLIGFFGSNPSIGTTSIARTFAKRIADKGYSVIVLGLDLYDPGWTGDYNVSLDLWRPRLTGKVLVKEDFDQLIQKDGFRYLPGNFDTIDTLDYQEEEIEYLLQAAQEHADVVIADFGSIPESAAWYVGLQKMNYRYYVSHPYFYYRAKAHQDIFEHLQITLSDFFLIVNRNDIVGEISPKRMAESLRMPLVLEFPFLENVFANYTLPIGKREQNMLDAHLDGILSSLGLAESKKKGLFA